MAAKLVARTLQVSGGICLLASIACIVPTEFIATIHRDVLGWGNFPAEPITIYLARFASALVAAGGVLSLTMSRDVVRFRPIIEVYAICIAVIPLWVMLITASGGLPWWFLVGDIVCSSLIAGLLWFGCQAIRDKSRA